MNIDNITVPELYLDVPDTQGSAWPDWIPAFGRSTILSVDYVMEATDIAVTAVANNDGFVEITYSGTGVPTKGQWWRFAGVDIVGDYLVLDDDIGLSKATINLAFNGQTATGTTGRELPYGFESYVRLYDETTGAELVRAKLQGDPFEESPTFTIDLAPLLADYVGEYNFQGIGGDDLNNQGQRQISIATFRTLLNYNATTGGYDASTRFDNAVTGGLEPAEVNTVTGVNSGAGAEWDFTFQENYGTVALSSNQTSALALFAQSFSINSYIELTRTLPVGITLHVGVMVGGSFVELAVYANAGAFTTQVDAPFSHDGWAFWAEAETDVSPYEINISFVAYTFEYRQFLATDFVTDYNNPYTNEYSSWLNWVFKDDNEQTVNFLNELGNETQATGWPLRADQAFAFFSFYAALPAFNVNYNLYQNLTLVDSDSFFYEEAGALEKVSVGLGRLNVVRGYLIANPNLTDILAYSSEFDITAYWLKVYRSCLPCITLWWVNKRGALNWWHFDSEESEFGLQGQTGAQTPQLRSNYYSLTNRSQPINLTRNVDMRKTYSAKTRVAPWHQKGLLDLFTSPKVWMAERNGETITLTPVDALTRDIRMLDYESQYWLELTIQFQTNALYPSQRY